VRDLGSSDGGKLAAPRPGPVPERQEHMTFIPPMLCSRLERLERLTERRYIAGPKLDGQRTQVHVRDGRTV
jgi:ATP-dependent DNA ligase